MPKEVFDKSHVFLPHSALLSFEEITRTARLFVAHGVRKLRLTGGEPLLRKNLERLVEMLAGIAHARRATRWTSRSRPTARCWRARRAR